MKLAHQFATFAAGGLFQTTLQSLAGNLTGLEEASAEFYPAMLVYSKQLERLEAEVCGQRLPLTGRCLPADYRSKSSSYLRVER